MVVSEMFLSYNAARFRKVALYQRFFSLTYQVLPVLNSNGYLKYKR